MKILFFMLALCLVLLQACASPSQIVEDAFEQLKDSPALDARLEATPCGMAAIATASATTSAQGVRGTALIIMRVEQECASTQANSPNPTPVGASVDASVDADAPQADNKEVQ